MENLLEKIIKEEKSEETVRLDAIGIVSNLFSDLLDREKDIISRRFGFDGGDGETLEKIGQMHKLTRERVRQIEAASIKKIKKLENLENYIGSLKQTVNRLVSEHGGLMRQDYLLDILTVICLELGGNDLAASDYDQNRSIYKNHFHFLISRILQDDLEVVDNSEAFNPSYKIKDQPVDHLEDLASDLLKKIDSLKKTLSTEDLLALLKELESYNKHQEKLSSDGLDISRVFKSQIFPDKAEIINSNKILYSLMQAIRNLEQNKYGHWGLADWKEIKPKTINDKIYLVLKNQSEPMHFTEIAKKINEVKFDKKTANAATVHNELILDNRYVLVGRGVYGLREWKK